MYVIVYKIKKIILYIYNMKKCWYSSCTIFWIIIMNNFLFITKFIYIYTQLFLKWIKISLSCKDAICFIISLFHYVSFRPIFITTVLWSSLLKWDRSLCPLWKVIAVRCNQCIKIIKTILLFFYRHNNMLKSKQVMLLNRLLLVLFYYYFRPILKQKRTLLIEKKVLRYNLLFPNLYFNSFFDVLVLKYRYFRILYW